MEMVQLYPKAGGKARWHWNDEKKSSMGIAGEGKPRQREQGMSMIAGSQRNRALQSVEQSEQGGCGWRCDQGGKIISKSICQEQVWLSIAENPNNINLTKLQVQFLSHKISLEVGTLRLIGQLYNATGDPHSSCLSDPPFLAPGFHLLEHPLFQNCCHSSISFTYIHSSRKKEKRGRELSLKIQSTGNMQFTGHSYFQGREI